MTSSCIQHSPQEMKRSFSGIVTCALTLGGALSLCDCSHLVAQQNLSARVDGESRTQQFLENATAAMREYEFSASSDTNREFALVEKPVLRWTNPIGGDWDGAVFLWTAEGRPEVVVSAYQGYHLQGQPVTHEFHSLSLDTFIAVRGERTVWHPKTAGVELKAIPDAPTPAKSSKLRLVQMRSLARNFTVEKTDRDGTPRTPRLLPQPLFRYESDNEELLDGALFVFAQSTDPEVFLLIEARKHEGSLRWHCGLARMNSVAFQVSYEDRELWRVPRITWGETRNRSAEYTVFPRQ